MLKSCKYCGRIHDSRLDCGKKPKKEWKKRNTEADRFRNTRAWQKKRDEIRSRDQNLCQLCIRELYHTAVKYNSRNLSVHHARPLLEDWEQRLANENLLTVCDYHHELAERGEIPLEVIEQVIAEQEAKEREQEEAGEGSG